MNNNRPISHNVFTEFYCTACTGWRLQFLGDKVFSTAECHFAVVNGVLRIQLSGSVSHFQCQTAVSYFC